MRASILIGNIPLDLFADEGINLTRKVKSLTDVGTLFTDFSQSFTIPATPNNNAVFEHYANLDIATPFDAQFGVDADLYVEGIKLFSGTLELVKASLIDLVPDSYEVVFYGAIKSLSNTFGEDTLQQINFDRDHTLNFSNIVSSWNGTLLSGDVRYPVVDYGARPTGAWVYGGTNPASNIANPAGAVQPAELRPAIRLTTALVRIFADYGLTLSIDSGIESKAEDMYVLGMEKEGYGIGVEGAIMDASTTGTVINFATANVPMSFTEVLDEANALTPSSGVFTAPFTANFTMQVTLEGASIDITVPNGFSWYQNGSSVAFINAQTYTAQTSGSTTLQFNTGVIPAGTTIQLVFTSAYSPSFTMDIRWQVIDYTPKNSFFAPVTIQQFMPSLKVREFVNGCLKMFNAVLLPDGDTYTLVNLYDWYEAGSTKDWTAYIDTSKIEISKIPVYRRINLKHKTSDDLANAAFKQSAGRQFGALEYLLDEYEFATDELVVETPFAVIPTTYENRLTSGGAVNGVTDLEIIKAMDTSGQPLQIPLTLLYWAGRQATGSGFWFGTGFQTQFPYFRNFSARPTVASTDAVTFGREDAPIGEDYPLETLYTEYWRDHFRRIYDPSTRYYEAQAYIPVGEWLRLDLSDEIVVAGRRFRIEELSYDLTTQRASVKLYTYDKEKVEAAITSITTGGGDVTYDFSPSANDLIRDNVKSVGSSYAASGYSYAKAGQALVAGQSAQTTAVNSLTALEATGFDVRSIPAEVLLLPSGFRGSPSAITLWADESGNGRDFAVVGSPTLEVVNGKVLAGCTVVDYFQNTTTFPSLSQPFTMAFAVRDYSAIGGLFLDNVLPSVQVSVDSTTQISVTSPSAGATPTFTAGFTTIQIEFNGASSRIRVDNQPWQTINPGTNAVATANALFSGTCNAAAFALYSGTLTDAQHDAVRNAFANFV
jgi:hypothetical protein